jgi:hypothetical protein
MRVCAQELYDAWEDAARQEREEKECHKAEQAQHREEKEREKQEATIVRAAKQQLSREKKATFAAVIATRKADHEARKLAAAEEKAKLAREHGCIVQETLIARKRSAEEAAE